MAIIQAARDVAEFGGRLDITPAAALMELIQAKAAEVAYWERRTQQLDESALTWGVTKTTVMDTVREAHVNVCLAQLHEAQRDLAAFAAAALRAGVEERSIQLAEDTARHVANVLIAALADQRLGIDIPEETRRGIIADHVRKLGLT